MAQTVGLARAAKMLGIGRRELQRLIRAGDLETFEGEVEVASLEARFPQLAMENQPILERLELLRTVAFTRRVQERVAPDRDELETQLQKRKTDLLVAQARADKYEQILQELARYLASVKAAEIPDGKAAVAEISRWLIQRMGR